MLYLIYGQNSFSALKKIKEIKDFFLKKNPSFSIENFNGEDADFESLKKIFQNISLFSKTRLFILKNVLNVVPKKEEFFNNQKHFLKDSGNIFVFWEKDLSKEDKIFDFFTQNAEKIQEAKLKSSYELNRWLEKEAVLARIKLDPTERQYILKNFGENSEWAISNFLEKFSFQKNVNLPKNNFQTKEQNTVFNYVDRIFSVNGSKSIFELKKARLNNIDSRSLINIIFWKLKKKSNLSKKDLELAWDAILADLNLKLDFKNEEENLERLVLKISEK